MAVLTGDGREREAITSETWSSLRVEILSLWKAESDMVVCGIDGVGALL